MSQENAASGRSAQATNSAGETVAAAQNAPNEADTAGLLKNVASSAGDLAAQDAPQGKQDHIAVELLKWTMNMTVAFGAQDACGLSALCVASFHLSECPLRNFVLLRL